MKTSVPKARSKKIRIGNCSYLVTRPYELLRELDFVTYVEDSPREIARRLHENELDVALIPASEFAVHGGYVGLDHGLACAESADNLFLCAQGPIDRLDTIYLYDGSSSSAVLLRLLLREEWHITPRLVRVPEGLDLNKLRDNEGVLVLQDEMPANLSRMAVVEDLVTAWDRLTNKPFVFLVWAVRPGVLTLKQHQALHEMFRRCVAAGKPIIESAAEASGLHGGSWENFLSARYSFYLDDNALAGLNSFYEKAAHYRLLPDAHYQSATFTLMNRRTIRAVKERELTEVLDSLLAGGRLGVRDGMRLAEFASFTDLALAADFARSKLVPERTVSHVCILEDTNVRNTPQLERSIESACARGAQRILLLPRNEDLIDVGFFENLIHSLHSKFPLWLEAFTIPQILRLAWNTRRPVQEVVSRLVTAGLDGVSGFGGGMLIDRLLKKRGHKFSAEEYLDAMKWVHRFGATSWCSLSLSPQEGWEERLMHLHKLRVLQDENPGFQFFHLESSAQWPKDPEAVETRLRALMISRLFLDNISSIQERDLQPSELPGILSLCLGANEIRIDVAGDQAAAEQSLRTLNLLRDLGMNLNESARKEVADNEVH
ncbi:MAG: hypothetical protein J0M12_08855 [Deltaproteobacteria bacterium]|nr:hypothetical protein [Deltaproteobacteria bacterium]